MFRTIGCVGDSLSFGEFEYVNDEGKTGYLDFYDYSWGQFIAGTTDDIDLSDWHNNKKSFAGYYTQIYSG